MPVPDTLRPYIVILVLSVVSRLIFSFVSVSFTAAEAGPFGPLYVPDTTYAENRVLGEHVRVPVAKVYKPCGLAA